jgi:signal transduction histidine kinase
MSLRTRLALLLVMFTAGVLIVQDVPLSRYLRTVERDRIVTALERDAFTFAGLATEALREGAGLGEGTGEVEDLSELQERIEAYAGESGARVVVVDGGGVAVATSDGQDVGQDYTNREEVATALAGRTASGERSSQSLGESLLYVAVPVRSGTNVLGAVRITYPSAEVDQAVNERVRGLLVAALVTLACAAFVGFLLATVLTRRLRRLERTAEQLAGGDLSARAEDESTAEMHALAQSFNTMAERVENLVDAQRGFAADASHQLRTPLTALRLRLDRTAELVDDDPSAALDSLEAAQHEAARLQRLVDGLLTLARAERGDVTQVVAVDVAALIRERAESWSPLAEERGASVATDIETGADDTLRAFAVPGAVEQIVDNYVDNALEVAPAGSVVRIELRRAGDVVDVRVVDSGRGMDPESRERAFDRYWRGGDSEYGGSGLGLAIARTLADASGGEVALLERDGDGLVARLTLRAAP